ncbi:MAG: Rhodanese-related sulfurtransferase [Verrucomicrobia bacterium]|jgi:rhodanese-related sulfurtransferase|nr:MAG: Rhodanese-related sulfurtransferase [Verrucomicrobiota bacterium]
MKQFLTLIVSLFFTAAVFAAAGKVTDISQPELQAAITAKSAVILDVNGTDSYKAGHIPGAIDYIAHKDQLAKLLPADKNALVVAYCGSPSCHAYAAAANAAVKLGYTNVKHFAPGISGWQQSGAATEKGH